ncbi:MAG: AtpZ/AtpI family protein [Pseudomonadota bacterium]|jgi:ATP synthase protein I|nr:MAG: ATP F0F1 synthase subunit I [Pseudomonadota bacterium]
MSDSDEDHGSGRGEISREDREALKARAARIGSRLEQVKARRAPQLDSAARGAAFGQAFKIAIELVVGVSFGGLVGWTLDRYFGSTPWLLVLFLVLGFTAGMLNVVRSARRMQAEAEPLQRAAPSVESDDEDEDR